MELRYYIDAQGSAPLTRWLEELRDAKARAQIRARLARIAAGNFGDCKALRDGVQELL
jgi:putative addiction module killer protein